MARPRPVLSREDWILAGQEILKRAGAPAIKLSALTSDLSVTSGSFYHHFKDFGEYVDALADHYGGANVEAVTEVVSQEPDAAQRLHVLLQLSRDWDVAGLDVAMRVWATTSDRARVSVAKLDKAFLSLVGDAFEQLGYEPDEARLRALLTFAAGIGRQLIFSDSAIREGDATRALGLLTADAPARAAR